MGCFAHHIATSCKLCVQQSIRFACGSSVLVVFGMGVCVCVCVIIWTNWAYWPFYLSFHRNICNLDPVLFFFSPSSSLTILRQFTRIRERAHTIFWYTAFCRICRMLMFIPFAWWRLSAWKCLSAVQLRIMICNNLGRARRGCVCECVCVCVTVYVACHCGIVDIMRSMPTRPTERTHTQFYCHTKFQRFIYHFILEAFKVFLQYASSKWLGFSCLATPSTHDVRGYTALRRLAERERGGSDSDS